MTAFFIKTESSAVGPFTGIELREAALSRIITTSSLIGPSRKGPWTVATDTGLFSTAKTPLPHPDGVHVPQYHVRGLSFVAEGPFKLRELIGFAARGMLLAEASLQSDLSPEWMPIDRIPILSACLTGEMVLVSETGRMVRQTTQTGETSRIDQQHAVGDAKNVGDMGKTRVPVEVARDQAKRFKQKSASAASEQSNHDAPLLSTGSFQDTPQVVGPDVCSEAAGEPKEIEEGTEAAPRWRQHSVRWEGLNSKISLSSLYVFRRVAMFVICVALLSASIATAFSHWRQIGLKPQQIIGSWIAEDDSFSLTFYEDGNCVVFNPSGNSWSGEYEWTVRTHDQQLLADNEEATTQIAATEPDDVVGDVRPTDGYVRFRSSALEPTFVGGKELSDAFLRLSGNELQLGYLTTVHWRDGEKRMEAGWIKLGQQHPSGLEPLSALAEMEFEPPPKIGFATERSPHVSVVAMQLMTQYETGAASSDRSDGLCYSVRAHADFLLQQFGAPDEARPVLPFDLARLPKGADFQESQAVRYGVLRLVLSSEGKLQHISVVQ
ncbi:hypothetical protein [Planctomycetes bacterium K23_9]|uniref:GYF domain-containing protein n=1 Tax=Stieleria marina TaxID=1930275 RepID=A0A517P311_9BACT|nr:hypothetical protein K239x_57900 [Planctomycetes bacterium K23_9]